MERGGLRTADLGDPHRAQRGQDVVLDQGAVRRGGVGLAARPGVLAHEALGKPRHGGRGLGRCSDKILATLDAVDDAGRLLPRLLTRHLSVAAERHALRAPRPSRLDHVDLPARGVYPHPEAGKVPVPEDGVVLLDG